MSMNINLEMSREVFVKKIGQTCIQTEHIDLWQTPTEISYEIQDSDNKLEAYGKWVLSISKDEEEDIFEADDIFCAGKPVRKNTFNSGKSHMENLVEYIRFLEAEGYEQTWWVS